MKRLLYAAVVVLLAAVTVRYTVSPTQFLIRTLAFRAGTGWAGEGLRTQHDVPVTMRDGVRLFTDLYLPATEGKHPAILVRTPYGKPEGTLIGEFFARYGYAVLVQDTRGRHKSEGDFYPFRDEAADGIDTTAWIRRQPWSNGKIGAFGASYLGFTQWALNAGNPHITAIAPTFISANLHESIYKGGAFSLLTYLHWSLTSYGRYGDGKGARNIETAYRHLPLRDADNAALRDLDFFNDWIDHPTDDAYWKSFSPVEHTDRMTAPAFLTAGWYDFMLDGQIRDFERLRRKQPETRLLIGPWSHSFFNSNLKNYSIEQRRLEPIPFEFVRASKDWFDYKLKGAPNKFPPVRLYVLGANVWRDEDDWPPRGTTDQPYYLQAKSLTTEPPKNDPPDTFAYDPANSVPTRGGAHGTPWTTGPADQSEIEKRPDVLTYSSAPVTTPVLVMGQVRARLYAASTAPTTDFTAKLVDVFPDGRALIVSEGILRSKFDPATARDIELGPIAVSFQPGHRIRLEISSSNFPRYDRNPTPATQTIHHDAAHPSALILPVSQSSR